MTNMVPLESSPLLGIYGGGFTDTMMMRETTINNQDSSGDTCSVSDPTAASITYHNISSSPVKDDGTAAKNDVVCSINVEDKDKSWLRLGIGPEDQNNTASYKLQRCCSENGSGREKSLELSLFSSSSAVAGAVSSSVNYSQPQPPQPPYPYDQLLTMRGPSLVYNHQLIRSQTLLNRGFSFASSKTWIPQYTAPFRPSSLSDHRDVTNNNNSVPRSCCVDEGGAGPSSEFRVLDPPRRPHSGLWFLLQASQFQ